MLKDDNQSCEVRLEEYLDIKRMIDQFGKTAYRAVRDYYRSCGYEAGYDLALSLIKEGLENSFDMTLSQALEWEAAHQSIMLQTRENREIVKMFLEMKKK